MIALLALEKQHRFTRNSLTSIHFLEYSSQLDAIDIIDEKGIVVRGKNSIRLHVKCAF